MSRLSPAPENHQTSAPKIAASAARSPTESRTAPNTVPPPRARASAPSSMSRSTKTVTVKAPQNREPRSEEHTSELQSRQYLVCRLLLEKKKIYLVHAFTLYFLSMILRKLTYTLYPSLFPTSFHIPHPQRSLPVAFTHPITVTAHDATPS